MQNIINAPSKKWGLRACLSANARIFLWIPTLLFLFYFFFFPLTRILNLTFSPVTITKPNLLITLNSLLFTFYQAILSTLLTFALGLPSAVLFSRFNFHGKSLLRALTAVPFLLPTVVVAASFNSLLGPRGLLNTILQSSNSLFLPPSSFISFPTHLVKSVQNGFRFIVVVVVVVWLKGFVKGRRAE